MGDEFSGVEQPHLVPAEVGEDVLRDIGDALSSDEREGEGQVHEQSAELGLFGIVVVEVYRRTGFRNTKSLRPSTFGFQARLVGYGEVKIELRT